MAETFNYWYKGALTLSLTNSEEFEFWYQGAPVTQFVRTTTTIPTVNFAGTGSLTVSYISNPIDLGVVGFGGSGHIDAYLGGPVDLGSAAFSGTGALFAPALDENIPLGSVAFSGVGTLTAQIVYPEDLGTAAFDGVGNLSAVVCYSVDLGSVNFSGQGELFAVISSPTASTRRRAVQILVLN
jgi:hypothetical protein